MSIHSLLIVMFAATATAATAQRNASTPPPLDLIAPTKYNPFISRATSTIVANEYVPISSALHIIRASALTPNARKRQSSFINKMIRTSEARIAFTIESPGNITRAHYARFYNVLFVDSYVAFRQIYDQMHATCFDYTGLYTIVLTENSRYQYDTIARILQDCWVLQIINVVVLVSIHPKARTAVYTYFPFSEFHCEAVAPVVLNFYVAGGFMWDKQFFPPKTHNLWGCPVRLAAYVLVPYMMLEKLEPPDERGYAMDGIDGITARVLAQRLNFTPIVRVSDVGRGQTYANGTFTGVFRMLMSGEVNLTIGAIAFTADRAKIMSVSTSYYQSPIHFAVPKGRNYTAFETLFLPYNTNIWAGTGVLFTLTACLFGVLRRLGRGRLAFVVGYENRTPFVNMIAVYIGAFLSDAMPVRNFARFVLMVWTLASLVLRSAYQGALFQYLQTQRMVAPIELLDDLMAANYSLRMNPPLFSLFDNMPKVKSFLAPTMNENNIRDFDTLIAHPHAKDVYMTTKLTAGYYNTHHMNRTVLLSRELMFIVPMVIYFRKHSCLTYAIDEQINRYHVAGLINKWLSGFYDERVLRKDAEQSLEHGERRALRLEQVSGAFQICALLLLFAVLVLVAELMAPYNGRVRALLDGI